ncbi:MAG: hypothetical protein HY821_18755 [Acidobacteria bacterium]|nr:hypothetical protein [Acidobacteriota bacterium]
MALIDLTRRQWFAITAGALTARAATPEELARQFPAPPDSARPWVYWFWKNGNISREGITADLEAMQQAGIGGVITMEVSLTTPKGPIEFFSSEWRDLFRHAVEECSRLGLQIEMNSAPGWTGSGGAWITPEQSMQKVTGSETRVQGPRRFSEPLPQPETVRDFYRDVAVLAFPTPASPHRIENLREKAFYERGPYSSKPGVLPFLETPARYPDLPRQAAIPARDVINLTARMDAAGRLAWDVPAGDWTILRFGHTSTGQTNRPAPSEGLECDKLDRAALDAHFRQFTEKLLADAGPARKALAGTHFDSWEVGAQNWSPAFAKEFQRRRGYDPIPWLPVYLGLVVESLERSERFLWDLRQTVSDLVAENHGEYMAELARRAGLFLSLEPYDMTPCDDMTLGATAGVPMCEFWSGHFDARYSVREATSVGHVYGRPIVGAEAFTSAYQDLWKLHPGAIKPIGDWAFSEGVNRFVIHRSVHQPFPSARPGLTLGQHGIHLERTQTWWNYSQPWHRYTARCQHLLRQGSWVADVLYLSPEGAPNVFQAPRFAPRGYKLDGCTPQALLKLAAVRQGRIAFPSGVEYRVLVLPELAAMTPELLARVRALVEQGATVVGMPPEKSPSLASYPQCDETVRQTAASMWGDAPKAEGLVERRVGQGRMFSGQAAAARRGVAGAQPPVYRAGAIWSVNGSREFRLTFDAPTGLPYARAELHAAGAITLELNHHGVPVSWVEQVLDRSRLQGFRRVDIFDLKPYLRAAANELTVRVDAQTNFPDELAGGIVLGEETILTGKGWTAGGAAVEVRPPLPINFAWVPPHSEIYPPAEAVEEVLRRAGATPDFTSPEPLRFAHRSAPGMEIYFVSCAEPRAVLAACTFRGGNAAPELWHPETGEIRPLPAFMRSSKGITIRLRFEPGESYFVIFRANARRGMRAANFSELREALAIKGPWSVQFDAKLGGPAAAVEFETLEDWTRRPEPGIRHYSGTAVYRKRINVPAGLAGRPLTLDLGAVREMARVRIDGKELGVVWHAPFRLPMQLAAGEHELAIEVVNLWPNRMIGDAALPEDAEWNEKGRLKAWPQWLLDGRSSPTGRITFTHVRTYSKDAPLLPSGLLGPVRILEPA